MHRHRSLCGKRFILPDAPVDIGARKHLAGVFEQETENVVLRRGERYLLAVECDALALIVHGDAAERERGVFLRHAAELRIAPELCLDSGEDLKRIEGLRDIIVRADGETEDLVVVLALGGDEDDRDVALLAQLCRRRHAVHAGHHDVHEHELYFLALHELERR